MIQIEEVTGIQRKQKWEWKMGIYNNCCYLSYSSPVRFTKRCINLATSTHRLSQVLSIVQGLIKYAPSQEQYVNLDIN